MKLVKCLVCGAVFDASLKVCPVCGVGSENFVPYEEQTDGESGTSTSRRVVILGGGPAAFYAARELRARDTLCELSILAEEELLPYNRPMLTKDMFGDWSGDAHAIEPASWYAEKNIDIRTGARVSALDVAAKKVTLADNTALDYDVCIYALGAHCFVPPIPGAQLPGVFAVRSAKDVRALAPRARGKAVVVGGGVLGLESAWELKKRGCDVCVFETAPRLMAGKLDEQTSSMLAQAAAKAGIDVFCGVNVERLCGSDSLTAAVLADTREFPAQLAIISTGVRANSEIAAAAGLKVNRGVLVDENMRTSDANVFACGDCAELDGVSYGVWPEAAGMGAAAGAAAAGANAPYRRAAPAVTLNAMGTALYSAGNVAASDVLFGKRGDGVMEKFFFDEGRLCGAALVGDISRLGSTAAALAAKDERDDVAARFGLTRE